MHIKAAIARNPRAPLSIEDVEVDEPRRDEVLVRVSAAGLSHTDLFARDGHLPMPLPAVLGREAAGIVERVGAAVTRLIPGDRVVLTFRSGELPTPGGPDLVDLNLSGARPDGSSPLRQRDRRIAGCFFGQSSHGTYALATERNAINVEEDVPFPILATLGGDVQTGAGSVINALRPQPGSGIAIFGAGAIGLSAVMAARLAGCHPIIATDIKASRLELAETLGATHTIDPDGVDPVEAVRGITGEGAEFSVETTGLPRVTSQAVECLRYGGSCALAGMGGADVSATLSLGQLRRGRILRGSPFGDSIPRPVRSATGRTLPAGEVSGRANHRRVPSRRYQPSRRRPAQRRRRQTRADYVLGETIADGLKKTYLIQIINEWSRRQRQISGA